MSEAATYLDVYTSLKDQKGEVSISSQTRLGYEKPSHEDRAKRYLNLRSGSHDVSSWRDRKRRGSYRA